MALKQAEILRLRHMTKKLERELQSSTRTLDGSHKSHDHGLAVSDSMDDRSTAGIKRKASPASMLSEKHDNVPKIHSHDKPRKQEQDRSIYEGKTYRELRGWVSEAETIFGSLTVAIDDGAKISDAIKFAAPSIQQRWQRHVLDRHGEDPCSWKDFVNFLERKFGDPEERQLKTLQVYHNAMPRANESVESFKAFLGRLEEELPPCTAEQSALHLKLRLRMASQRPPSGQDRSSQKENSKRGDADQNRAAQWSAPRGPTAPRGGQRRAQPGRNRGGRHLGSHQIAHREHVGENPSQNQEGQKWGWQKDSPRRPYP
ncbi:MAG: hypothetical protein LQ337_001099 [Flavoplaca oasis]|nr:MAG: hypothetical protein LQ337_001099 [Flavoplaca oasis]